MHYHPRILEQKVNEYWDAFPCVLLAGARQVGKSTMLARLFAAKAKTFTFDPVQDLFGERADPDLFLRNNPPPLVLDEIQYVPELVPALKRAVDRNRRSGMYMVTGSQQWEVMRHLSESLAGRIAIVELPTFCLAERHNAPRMLWFADWLRQSGRQQAAADAALLAGRSAGISPAQWLWRGMYPELGDVRETVVPGWMRGYVSSYLQRDIRKMLEIRDEALFARFLALCAALTAQEVNHSQLGRDLDISSPTAQKWLAVLRATYQWFDLPAFSGNLVKHVSQKPKGHMADTGLACSLLRMSSPEAVPGHPAFGALFESGCVGELLKQTQTLPLPPTAWHYRQHSGTEVDAVFELDGLLTPVEIKAASSVGPRDTLGLRRFMEQHGKRCRTAIILYAGEKPLRVAPDILALPFDLLA